MTEETSRGKGRKTRRAPRTFKVLCLYIQHESQGGSESGGSGLGSRDAGGVPGGAAGCRIKQYPNSRRKDKGREILST